MAKWPRPVEQGATIGLVSPASPIDEVRLTAGIAALTERGYRVVEMPNVRQAWHFVAGSDAQRLADFHQAFADPDIDVVWCTRGGYGCMRLLSGLDWDLLAANQKPFVGYSDITTLQMAMLARLEWVTVCGPMVASGHGFGRTGGIEDETEAGLWRWLRPDGKLLPLRNPDGEPFGVLRGGNAAGALVGGNLILFTALVGTPYLPNVDGAILAIEDVDEHPDTVDRALAQLELAGILDRLGGVLIGDFSNYLRPDDTGPAVEEIVMGRVGDRPLPVLSRVVFGHCDRRMSLPLGSQVELSADSDNGAVLVHTA